MKFLGVHVGTGFLVAAMLGACAGRSFEGGDDAAGKGGEAGDPGGGGVSGTGPTGGVSGTGPTGGVSGTGPTGGVSGTGPTGGVSGTGGSVPTGGSGPMCMKATDCPVVDLPCFTCASGDVLCPTAECSGGHCFSRIPQCPGTDPCEGRSCGEGCDPCIGQDCPVTELPFTCNTEGQCTDERPACLGRCMTYLDCPPPPPDCGGCTNGACADVDCIQGICEMVCDPRPRCTTPMDCPLTMICVACPNSQCAAQACIEGRCDYACPEL
jgi:hypothetical protein